ncbi:MAG: cell division protein FtsZ, partial [Ignavibacteriales bacterium CG12_big_fil_rev_8_21_14_0_65_30_8]
AQKAISSPLLEGLNIKGAKSILLNVTGSTNLTMHEINEGNNVIFEAAGEDANVIFGCVRKDEMNDYVSYTVIATGFSSARIKSAPKKQENKEKEIFRGGFDFLKSSDVDNEDLDVPTIMRVNKPKATLDENKEETLPESGFKFESSRYNWAKDKAEKKKEEEEVNSDDDEDSSSFLRMIMD